MTNTSRRGFLTGLTALVAAPAIVRVENIMKISVPKLITELPEYDPVILSIVRLTCPKLLAHEICAVQPMTGPTGLQYALGNKFKEDELFS